MVVLTFITVDIKVARGHCLGKPNISFEWYFSTASRALTSLSIFKKIQISYMCDGSNEL